MFRGTVDRTSHEGGLLLTFSGSSPALGSIIVREEDGHYIGKVDAVLGSTEAPLAHVAHLDRKQDNDAFIGATVTIRAKKEREERPRREQRSERPQRRNDRSFDRRDNRQRSDEQKDDWVCAACENVNFSWRKECNSCGKGKDGNVKAYKSSFRDNNRSNNRRDRPQQERHGRNDWICSSCGNDNFSFRTECNKCGKSKAGGEGQERSRGGFSDRGQHGSRGSGRRGGSRDGGRGFGGGHGRDSDRRGGRRDGGRSFGGNRDGRDDRRDSGRGRPSRDRNDERPNERYRKARGKRPGHAHNRGPQPIRPRRYQGKNRDD
ncbi:MAG: zinc finger Ran-binding domain-containing protein [Candidatus Thermoplasmatota archaeon]|nr:zinc finger Ran-binding domain-containing protein [Candidatus Thermoplasmatota archaeon]